MNPERDPGQAKVLRQRANQLVRGRSQVRGGQHPGIEGQCGPGRIGGADLSVSSLQRVIHSGVSS